MPQVGISGAVDGYNGNLATYTTIRYHQAGSNVSISPNWKYTSFCGHGTYLRLQLYGYYERWYSETIQVHNSGVNRWYIFQMQGGGAIVQGWFAMMARTNAAHCTGYIHTGGHNFDGYNTGDLYWSAQLQY